MTRSKVCSALTAIPGRCGIILGMALLLPWQNSSNCEAQLVKPIYLDYNATTPIDPRVRDAMLPYLREHFGNPSTSYSYGQLAKGAIERAREHVAALIGALPGEVIFTSGGSESDNQAIIGAALANAHKGRSEEHTSELQS